MFCVSAAYRLQPMRPPSPATAPLTANESASSSARQDGRDERVVEQGEEGEGGEKEHAQVMRSCDDDEYRNGVLLQSSNV